MRESPALDILELLDAARRGHLSYTRSVRADAEARRARAGGDRPKADALSERPDCAVICTDHSAFDWKALVDSGVPVVDTRNALRAFSSPAIVRLSGRALPAPVIV